MTRLEDRKATRLRPVILCATEHEGGWGSNGPMLRFKASFHHEHPDGRFLSFSDSDPDPMRRWADLSVRAQCTTYRRDGGPPSLDVAGGWYGWGVEYRQPFSVDLARAKVMASELARIARRLDRDTEQLGYPATLGAFLLRAAAAVGVPPRTGWRWERLGANGRWHPDGPERMGAEDAARRIDEMPAAWAAEHGVAAWAAS